VRIIARSRLMDMAEAHGDCVDQAADWYKIARNAKWHNLVEVRESFRHADIVGDRTVFNIKGALPIKSVVLEQLSALFVHSE